VETVVSTFITLALALAIGLGAGYALAVIRRTTAQTEHDRAVAKFAQANRLRPSEPTADPAGTTVSLEGIRLRFVGTHPDGADVYVNAEPLPVAVAVHIEGMADDTTVVIMESPR
jgi:hypothetical protein